MKVFLSFGYDTERPRESFADGPEGRKYQAEQLEFVRKINKLHDSNNTPRTHFILGNYLEKCLENYTSDFLKEVFSGAEIQQHSYSHPLIGKVKTYEDRKIMKPKEFGEDLKKASEIIESVWFTKPTGLRIPIGYHHDLSEMPEILKVLSEQGIEYVSSNLRNKEDINGALNEERQPHSYKESGFQNIFEIPSHGWQDTIFIPEKSQKYLGRDPDSPEEIVKGYQKLFTEANEIGKVEVFISLCLHPWAMMKYDPDLEIHEKIIKAAKSEGVEIVPYGDIPRISQQKE